MALLFMFRIVLSYWCLATVVGLPGFRDKIPNGRTNKLIIFRKTLLNICIINTSSSLNALHPKSIIINLL
jgi:hypothetical protein